MRAIDFRGASERAAQAYALPGAYHPLTIEPTVIHRALALQQQGHTLTAQDAVGLMRKPTGAFCATTHRFAEMFRLLLDSDSPIVFTARRAGPHRFAAALILLALGVRATVMGTTCSPTASTAAPKAWPAWLPQKCWPCCGAYGKDFLDAALHRVDADYGGIDTWWMCWGWTPSPAKNWHSACKPCNPGLRAPAVRDSHQEKRYTCPPTAGESPCKSSPTCSFDGRCEGR